MKRSINSTVSFAGIFVLSSKVFARVADGYGRRPHASLVLKRGTFFEHKWGTAARLENIGRRTFCA